MLIKGPEPTKKALNELEDFAKIAEENNLIFIKIGTEYS
jgi:hypothetical protein